MTSTLDRPLYLVPDVDDETPGYVPASPDTEAEALAWVAVARREAVRQGRRAAKYRRKAAECARLEARLLAQAAELEGVLWA